MTCMFQNTDEDFEKHNFRFFVRIGRLIYYILQTSSCFWHYIQSFEKHSHCWMVSQYLFYLSLYPGMHILVLFGIWLPPLRIHSDFADGIYVCIYRPRWSHTKIKVGHNYSWLWSILNWRHLCGMKYAEMNNTLIYVAYCKCLYILWQLFLCIWKLWIREDDSVSQKMFHTSSSHEDNDEA